MLEHALIALALHCGHGEMFRVHLHKCVPKSSALALVAIHKAPPAKPCCYVEISIKVRPDEVVTDEEIAELARATPHVWIETVGSTRSFTLEQQARLWTWLMNTMGMKQ
jgi:hypothetical protein